MFVELVSGLFLLLSEWRGMGFKGRSEKVSGLFHSMFVQIAPKEAENKSKNVFKNKRPGPEIQRERIPCAVLH